MFLTRNRHVSLFGGRSAGYTPLPLHENDRPRQQNGNGHRHADHRERLSLSALSSPSISSASSASSRRRSRRSYDPYPPKARTVLGCFTIQTPNSSRFAGHFHSRILQKFPFLIEMFYWVLTFLFYRMTAVGAEAWYGGSSGHDGGAGSSAASISVERSNILARTGLPADGGPPVDPSVRRLWDAAQAHGVWLLETEARYWWRWILFGGHRDATGTERWAEWRLQQWFLAGMQAGDWRGIWLSVLNRSYALIHIPGTVGYVTSSSVLGGKHARTWLVTNTCLFLFAAS